MVFQRFLDIRYSGQEFSIPVLTRAKDIEQADAEAIRKAFDDLHDRRYGYHAADQPIEIVNVRLSAIGKRKQLGTPALKLSGREKPMIGKRMVYLDSKKATECSIYRREKLAPGYKVTGPAIIQEYACTTVLFPGDTATVAETSELVIDIGEGNNGGG